MVTAVALIAMAGERDIVGEGERVGDDSAAVGEGETVGEVAAEDDADISTPSTDAGVVGLSDGPAHTAMSTQLSFVEQHASMPSNVSSHGALSTMPPQSDVPFGEQSRTHDVPVSRSR